ncbi:MAG: hypothetical protein AVDCRST_MAG33-369 [uncultured Thermomicrobiales bacterium]|uniref:Uncharacterized protein n=1 Tax=uncultured Thermomicrobiales bacterium TaxID=1645740 RepID=A0A6J4UD34_9BACT|nr:MAG: hypothetical protein AVDCRST_MAG33-369 [uncultured Thermomicrobiales bacterium]
MSFPIVPAPGWRSGRWNAATAAPTAWVGAAVLEEGGMIRISRSGLVVGGHWLGDAGTGARVAGRIG